MSHANLLAANVLAASTAASEDFRRQKLLGSQVDKYFEQTEQLRMLAEAVNASAFHPPVVSVSAGDFALIARFFK